MASLLQEMSFCSFAPKGPTCGYQRARLSRASHTQPAAGATLPKQFPSTFLILITQHVHTWQSARPTVHTERGEGDQQASKNTKTPQKQLKSWTGQQNNRGQHAANTARDRHGSWCKTNILTPAWLTPSTHLSKHEGTFILITFGVLHNSHHQTTPCTRLVTPGPARASRVRDTEMAQQLFPPSLLKPSAPPPGRLHLSNTSI